MPERDDRRAAAASLGLTLRQFGALERYLAPLRHAQTISLNEPLVVYPSAGGEPLWEIEVTGELVRTVGTRHVRITAAFRFRIFIDNLELWSGSCVTPDWFKVTVGKNVVFEGEVEHPDNPDDTVGWLRYDAFKPVRLEAWDAATARLATKRIEVNVIGS